MTGDLYTLPDLAYDPGALEPHISGRIMELHHDKHHAAYVRGANTALERLHDIREKGDFSAISMLEKNLAFNVSGHVLHSVFWTNLLPHGGGEPSGDLADVIAAAFGDFAVFKVYQGYFVYRALLIDNRTNIHICLIGRPAAGIEHAGFYESLCVCPAHWAFAVEQYHVIF